MHPAQQVANDGFVLIPDVLTESECEQLTNALSSVSASIGTRRLLQNSWCRSLVLRLRADASLSPLLSPELVAVQCTYFEKSLTRNWLVPVHQDLSIPVASRVGSASLKGWSEKEGSLFVQAPLTLLQQLLAVRVHLDACSSQDGPLRVITGSHALGRIGAEEAVSMRLASHELVCEATRGSVLAMRPLLLHSSSKARGTSTRRVLHFLFGPTHLPLGLQWRDAV